MFDILTCHKYFIGLVSVIQRFLTKVLMCHISEVPVRLAVPCDFILFMIVLRNLVFREVQFHENGVAHVCAVYRFKNPPFCVISLYFIL